MTCNLNPIFFFLFLCFGYPVFQKSPTIPPLKQRKIGGIVEDQSYWKTPYEPLWSKGLGSYKSYKIPNHIGSIRYLLERKQFGAPLAAFQLNQEKLIRMLGNIQVMSVLGWRLCKLHDNGKMTSGRHLSVDCADLDHKTGAGDGGARQGAPRRQWHRHQFPCWQGWSPSCSIFPSMFPS